MALLRVQDTAILPQGRLWVGYPAKIAVAQNIRQCVDVVVGLPMVWQKGVLAGKMGILFWMK